MDYYGYYSKKSAGYKIRKEQVGTKDKYIKYIEIDEPQADVVRFVFKEFASGNTKDNIAKELNIQGHRDKNGKPFVGKSFDRMLSNEKYTGNFTYGGRQVENMYPQVIDPIIFNRVNEKLKANQYGKNAPKEPCLLTGKVFCGHCESDVVSDGGVSRTGQVHNYYACKKKKKDKCDKRREAYIIKKRPNPNNRIMRWFKLERTWQGGGKQG